MTNAQERFLRALMRLCKEHDVKMEMSDGLARVRGPSCYLEVFRVDQRSVNGYDLESHQTFDLGGEIVCWKCRGERRITRNGEPATFGSETRLYSIPCPECSEREP